MDLGLEGKACIVTGASSGIGAAVAEMLCAEGARVLLVGRNRQRLSATAEACAAGGGLGTPLQLDITQPDAGDQMVAAAHAQLGQVDVLVNNAGSANWRNLGDVTDADWQSQWELNVMAPMRAMRAAIPGMCERGWGRVVNVSSSAGKRPSKQMPDYSVAKAAELSLSRLYADWYANENVLINAVCPGPVESPIWIGEGGLADQSAGAAGHGDRQRALEKAAQGRPIGRLATVDEIASTIVFLCSERASYVAGAAWSVDGGTVQVII